MAPDDDDVDNFEATPLRVDACEMRALKTAAKAGSGNNVNIHYMLSYICKYNFPEYWLICTTISAEKHESVVQ